MSMRAAIASALQMFAVLIFFLTGVFFLLLPTLPLTRELIIQFLTERYLECSHIGLGIILVGFLFFLGFYNASRGKYLMIKMGVTTHIKTIKQSTVECFAKHFPEQIALKELEVGPQSTLDFTVHFAPLDEGEREELYSEVEKQLGVLLQERFGFTKSFHLIVNV